MGTSLPDVLQGVSPDTLFRCHYPDGREEVVTIGAAPGEGVVLVDGRTVWSLVMYWLGEPGDEVAGEIWVNPPSAERRPLGVES